MLTLQSLVGPDTADPRLCDGSDFDSCVPVSFEISVSFEIWSFNVLKSKMFVFQYELVRVTIMRLRKQVNPLLQQYGRGRYHHRKSDTCNIVAVDLLLNYLNTEAVATCHCTLGEAKMIVVQIIYTTRGNVANNAKP